MIRTDSYRRLKDKAIVAAYTLFVLMLFASCDVHEFPEETPSTPIVLRLRFDTDMPWEMFVSDNLLQGMSSRSISRSSTVRYIVRLYSPSSNKRTDVAGDYLEYIYTTTADDIHNNDLTINLLPGNYSVMVWADFIDQENGGVLYNADDFSEIKVQFPYMGNTDYRDAFRGTAEISLSDFTAAVGNGVVKVDMSRPLAKFELISTDLKEFLAQEVQTRTKRNASLASSASSVAQDMTGVTKSSIDFSNYRIKFFYEGYMPTSYSMFTDKPVDAMTGVSFDGAFNVLSDDEVSLGFDYVFVNHKETSISIRMGLYNQQGELISLTQPIDVPLKRSTQTLMRGRYLMEKASGSVAIDPSYDDEYNIVL